MDKGKGAKKPVRDWLDKSAKPNSQKTKPTATVKPVQSSFPKSNSQPSQSSFAKYCTSEIGTAQHVRPSYPNVNKANHQSSQNCARPAAGQQKKESNNHRIHVPRSSGVNGNIALGNSVQININVQKNHQSNYHKKPASDNNTPKPNIPRKSHAPESSGVNKNVAAQNSVQLNVNVNSNVKNTRPRSNNIQHVNNSAKLQSAAGAVHTPAKQNNSNKKIGIKGTRVKRIIGGNFIKIEAAPYMLSMRLNDEHICGAVIIGEQWGLTAAHCCIEISKTRADSLYVKSGSSNLYKGGKVHKITRLVRHERYVADVNDDYDICAVQVNPPFEYSNSTSAVKLADPNVPFDNSRGLVTGWGYTKADGKVVSPVLKSLNVRRVDLQRCKHMYRNLYTVHDRDVCYEAENDSGDACEGDSGGPLVNDDTILLGIVSFGDECGYSTLPGVYTDTIQFRDWIKNKTDI